MPDILMPRMQPEINMLQPINVDLVLALIAAQRPDLPHPEAVDWAAERMAEAIGAFGRPESLLQAKVESRARRKQLANE
jgi:hypothetical protein